MIPIESSVIGNDNWDENERVWQCEERISQLSEMYVLEHVRILSAGVSAIFRDRAARSPRY